MPPRYTYWTIIAGGLPTAFRAADRDELLPTFRRIQEKHPDAILRWFARGQLWDSPEAARADLISRRTGGRQGPGGADHRERAGVRRGEGATRPPGGRPSSPRDWRPGGQHRDPRQPYKDAKRARNQRQRAERFARRTDTPPPRAETGGPKAPARTREYRSTSRGPRGPRGPRRS